VIFARWRGTVNRLQKGEPVIEVAGRPLGTVTAGGESPAHERSGGFSRRCVLGTSYLDVVTGVRVEPKLGQDPARGIGFEQEQAISVLTGERNPLTRRHRLSDAVWCLSGSIALVERTLRRRPFHIRCLAAITARALSWRGLLSHSASPTLPPRGVQMCD